MEHPSMTPDQAESPAAFIWHGRPVYRVCMWCKRRLVDHNTPTGDPVLPDVATTDGVCSECEHKSRAQA